MSHGCILPDSFKNYSPRPLPQCRREREGLGGILTLMTALFHATFKGAATEPSAKVVTDNETDSVFAEWTWRGFFIWRRKLSRRGFRIFAVFYSIFGCLLFV